jgi:release factor glutamine methyltransferase
MSTDTTATVDGLVAQAATRLTEAGVASARVDAMALLGHVLGVDASEVARRAILRASVGETEAAAYDGLVSERCRRVPLQHLTGVAHFRRLSLRVGPGVFVPRPETELAVSHVLSALATLSPDLPRGAEPVVVDLCTGSGAIALSVRDESPDTRVYAVELSPEAHAWARANIDALRLDVDLRLADATDATGDAQALPELDGLVDVVVSNPPYIPVDRVPVDPEVRDHDPELALYGGSIDGLAIPLAVADRAWRLLRPGGRFVMEHADEQGEALVERLTARGWAGVEDHRDLAGRPRHVTATRPARERTQEGARSIG